MTIKIESAGRGGERGSQDSSAEAKDYIEQPPVRIRIMWLWRILLLMVLLVTWQLMSGRVIPTYAISRPTDIADQIGNWIHTGSIYGNLWITIQEALIGLGLGFGAGAIAAVLVGWFDFLERLLSPFIVALYGIPHIPLIPIFILWFGIGMNMKVIFIAFVICFIVFWTVLGGVKSTNTRLRNTVLIMGANPAQILRLVILPSALEWIYVALNLAVPLAVTAAVVSDMLASNAGLGYLILAAAGNFDPAAVFAALLIVCLLVVALRALTKASQLLLMPWKRHSS